MTKPSHVKVSSTAPFQREKMHCTKCDAVQIVMTNSRKFPMDFATFINTHRNCKGGLTPA